MTYAALARELDLEAADVESAMTLVSRLYAEALTFLSNPNPGGAAMSRSTAEKTTTQARLSAVIKESRNIMRKDAGLNGDLDRLPQMAWLLFLKAFDDLEVQRQILDRTYLPVIQDGFRWGDWVSGVPTSRRTGDALTRFVDGRLLPYLAKLQGSGKPGDPRDTLGSIFRETRNRMLSGLLAA